MLARDDERRAERERQMWALLAAADQYRSHDASQHTVWEDWREEYTTSGWFEFEHAPAVLQQDFVEADTSSVIVSAIGGATWNAADVPSFRVETSGVVNMATWDSSSIGVVNVGTLEAGSTFLVNSGDWVVHQVSGVDVHLVLGTGLTAYSEAKPALVAPLQNQALAPDATPEGARVAQVSPTEDYRWFFADAARVEKYRGSYVCVFRREVVHSAPTYKECRERGKALGVKSPLVFYVPSRDEDEAADVSF
jgi:hypothetical protein